MESIRMKDGSILDINREVIIHINI